MKEKKDMKPIIGITADFSVKEGDGQYSLDKSYASCIAKADGLPMILPYDHDNIETYLSVVSGVLISGGADIAPYHYQEFPHKEAGIPIPERDAFELELCKKAIERDIPLLGVCRGAQILNVALGGNLIQHIENDEGHRFNPHAYKHVYVHEVELRSGSKLYELLNIQKLPVNSWHHQCVDRLGTGILFSSKSPNGIVESIEVEGKNFAIGVQWHPEELFDVDEKHASIYREFVKMAKSYAEDNC
ncbi:MAG: gamma-glutamyl-gamma-aminobutyrate hydrolase family protein [Oscillospiraceae bacterium]|nr:gamma-glutamyl-gamma-aminobutyrate hydrolase family protein [Oscillospiraceae bacterium]